MNFPTDPRNRSSHGAYPYHLEANMVSRHYDGMPYDPNLVPIRRVDNQIPAGTSFRPSAPASGYAMAREHNTYSGQRRDAESVLNFSQSLSESEDDDSSEYSEERITYSYTTDVEDESPADNFNCINALFPASKNQGGGLIQCHRVGPRTAEVQLNIPLPSRYIALLDSAGGKEGGSHKVLNCAPTQYNPTLIEDAVLEVDPYKQYRERIAPQFFASLMESDGDDSDTEDDTSVERQRDDSQIFGEFDAHRNAMQQALYNQLVLQNNGYADKGFIHAPPDQIFVTESSSTVGGTTDEEAESQSTAYDLSINMSAEVFSQPQERQNDSLYDHLRESVQAPVIANANRTVCAQVETAVPRIDVPTSKITPNISIVASHDEENGSWSNDDVYDQDGASIVSLSGTPEECAELKKMKEDDQESSTLDMKPKNKYQEQIAKRRVAKVTSAQTKTEALATTSPFDGSEEPGRITPRQSPEEAPTKSSFEIADVAAAASFDEPGRITPHSQGGGASIGESSFETADMSVSISFDEPGHIQVQNSIKEPEQKLSVRALAAKKFASMVIPSFEEAPRRSIKPRMGARLPAIKEQDMNMAEDDESPGDENNTEPMKETANNTEPMKETARFTQSPKKHDLEQLVKKLTLEAACYDKVETVAHIEVRGGLEENTITSSREYHTSQENACIRVFGTDDANANGTFANLSTRSTPMSPRFMTRSILEETSKTNVRTEILAEHGSAVERHISSRELRKNRIRGMDATPRPYDASAPLDELLGMVESVSSNQQPSQSSLSLADEFIESRDDDCFSEPRAGGDALRDGVFQEPPPDLDDLLEFHSCDEDFFTGHMVDVVNFPM